MDVVLLMLKLSMRQPITEQVSRELIEWVDSNKMKRALEVLAKKLHTRGADAGAGTARGWGGADRGA